MINDLKNILEQINQTNETLLIPVNLYHPLYWIWKAENYTMKDLYKYLRPVRPEHARYDIFINGQYISEVDYTQNAFKKAQKHTALADVHESIDEMIHYREHFLKL